MHTTGDFAPDPHHQITLICDDLEATRSDLASRGAEFTGEPVDDNFGITVYVKVPGSTAIMIYQPKHQTAYDLA